MKICSTEDEINKYVSCWGNFEFELTREEIEALLEGKTLVDPEDDVDCGVIISMREGEEDA